MDVFWTVAYTSFAFILLHYLYRYLMRPFEYWKKRGVRSVPAIPLVGSMYENFTQNLHEVFQNRYKKYGKIYGYYESNRPVISVADPELLKDILVKDFQFMPNRREFSTGDAFLDKMVSNIKGEEWKRVRTIITPAFSSGKIKKMSSIFLEAAMITTKNFEAHAANGKPADCKRVFGAFTMDVIARSAFGTIVDSHNDPDNDFVQNARLAFTRGVTFNLILFTLSPKLFKAIGARIFPKKSTEFFTDVTIRIIKQRRETGQRHNDFLQLLMDAADEAKNLKDSILSNEENQEDETEKAINDLGHDRENKEVFKVTKKYKELSYDELIAQCVLFFLAGYDTTASTLSFASYLLALNPECQETLIKEIDETLAKNNNKLTYESVQSMKYLENVIWETLRLFPPAVGLERKAEEDYKLGGTGITIPKDMIVAIPTYAIHHDPEYYHDPEKFDPNRFTQQEKDKRNPYTFIPFGAGPRNCVGMRFALTEIKFCLASVFSKYRMERCPETKVPIEFFKGQGLLQPRSIQLRIKTRKDGVN